MAAKELGMKEVPVSIMEDLSEAEVKYLRIKDNRASEQSDWDYEAYQTEQAELRDMDYDVADLEYDIDIDYGTEVSADDVAEDDFDETADTNEHNV